MRTLKLAAIAILLLAAAYAGAPRKATHRAFLPAPDSTAARAERLIRLIATGERPDGTTIPAGDVHL